MSQGTEAALYRESRSFVPPFAGWAILAVAVYMAAQVAWNWAHGERDLVFSLPGVVGFLAIGLGAVVARQYVEVTPSEVLVGNSPRLSRRIRLVELQRVEEKEHPPSRWQLTWPLSSVRVYSMDRGPGVLLTLTGGDMVFIGTREPTALVRAISAAAPHVPTTAA